MRKIALLAINAKYVHSALAVWILSDSVKRYASVSHEVEVIEATIHQSDDEIVGLVAAHKPDVVGISTYIWNGRKLQSLLPLLRKYLPGAVFILGGPEASFNSDFWLESGADYVVHGEGEQQLPALLDQLATGEAKELMAKKTNQSVNPYNDQYVSTLKGKLVYLETSRGCPFRCAFCLSGEDDVRFFPIEMAKSQLLQLSKTEVKTIKLVDRTFNCNAKRAYELLEYVISLDTNCCFHFEIAADLFDDETIALLKTAQPGRIQFEAGLQSYHGPTLKAILRKTNLEKAEKNIRAILDIGNIHFHVDLIAGLPYETLEIFKTSFNKAFGLGAHNLQLGFLKLLHGSVLRKRAKELGIIYNETPPYEIISSPWLDQKDLIELKQTENALRQTYNKGRFLSTLDYVLSSSHLSPYDLFSVIGRSVANHGMPLEVYAEALYSCLCNILNEDEIQEYMIYDWLSMVRGKNMPKFMRKPDTKRKAIIPVVEKILNRKICREEIAFLPSGKIIYVDVEDRNIVTGLYKVYTLEV